MTPCRTTTAGRVIYSDHLGIKVVFKDIPKINKKANLRKKVIKWNLGKEEGWIKFKELTTDNKVLDDIANGNSEDVEDISYKIEREINNIKYMSFGKMKQSSGVKRNKKLEMLQDQRKSLMKSGELEKAKCIENQIHDELEKEQKRSIHRELDRIENVKKRKEYCNFPTSR